MWLLKFAFRNVLRNKKRSRLTAIAIFVAAMVVAIAMGWVDGLFQVIFESHIKYQTGNIRITTENFVKREKFSPVDEILYNSESLSEKIKTIPGVSSVEERIRFGIILGNGDKTVFAFGVGIDLFKSILNIKEKIIDGKIEDEGIYIGKNLAKKLNIKIGEDILIASRTSEGGLNGIKLPVKGIFQFNVITFDDQFFFVSLKDAKRLLKIPEGTTELLVYTKDYKTAGKVLGTIKSLLSEGEKVMDVKEQLGSLYDFVEIGKYVYYFFYAIIVFLATFVVINTMMMAVFERTREIGTLKAMGLTDREVFINFIYEGAILGASGATAGGVVGFLANLILNKTGVNFDFAFQGISMPMEYIIRPTADIYVLIVTIIMSTLLTAISTIFPARRAGKLMPAEALRRF